VSEWSPLATRRTLLKGAAMSLALAGASSAFTRRRSIRLGLIGCGGRGAGAVASALRADPNVQLTAVADAFADRIGARLNALKQQFGERADVPRSRHFAGFDAYEKVLDSGVDLVILASPPHFRPIHLRAAIEAGVHVFAEKPMAVDAPGYRSLLETSALANKKGLCVASGFELRYSPPVRQAMEMIHDGAIGDVRAVFATYNIGYLWHRGRRPEWTEMEYQVRNWYYFTWLSGDHIVEQCVHLIDLMTWVAGDRPPATAWGYGGRAQRTEPKWGDIFDHHAVVYDFPNGLRASVMTRQQLNCFNQVSFRIVGAKGDAELIRWGGFRFRGAITRELRTPSEHPELSTFRRLFQAIRSGTMFNEIPQFALSTMVAIMGRMATHSGQLVDWPTATESQLRLAPNRYAWDADPPVLPRTDGSYPHAIPGFTQAF